MNNTKTFIALVPIMILALALVSCNGRNSGTVPGGNTDLYSSATVGDIVQFGGYDWIVLDVQNGKALIISDKILAKRAYYPGDESITWEESSVRGYLNGSFYDGTFTTEEKARISETSVINDNNPWFGTNGGIVTVDKLFLLSIEEVVQYFGDSGELEEANTGRVFVLTDQYNSARIAYDETGTASLWWLRSPGDFTYKAALVTYDGILSVMGGFAEVDSGGVRPALWMDLG
ncbi:MAG: DUF6273 domain-containing protein [Peptococcaceae bacterium]|jgi:hypothetical protein|nr:DUF6273 domain-containing protein [Peptococcaceae bacterium]